MPESLAIKFILSMGNARIMLADLRIGHSVSDMGTKTRTTNAVVKDDGPHLIVVELVAPVTREDTLPAILHDKLMLDGSLAMPVDYLGIIEVVLTESLRHPGAGFRKPFVIRDEVVVHKIFRYIRRTGFRFTFLACDEPLPPNGLEQVKDEILVLKHVRIEAVEMRATCTLRTIFGGNVILEIALRKVDASR